jgi:hypothetical protein
MGITSGLIGLDEFDAAILRAPFVGCIVGNRLIRTETFRAQARGIDAESDQGAKHGTRARGGELAVAVRAAGAVRMAFDGKFQRAIGGEQLVDLFDDGLCVGAQRCLVEVEIDVQRDSAFFIQRLLHRGRVEEAKR